MIAFCRSLFTSGLSHRAQGSGSRPSCSCLGSLRLSRGMPASRNQDLLAPSEAHICPHSYLERSLKPPKWPIYAKLLAIGMYLRLIHPTCRRVCLLLAWSTTDLLSPSMGSAPRVSKYTMISVLDWPNPDSTFNVVNYYYTSVIWLIPM